MSLIQRAACWLMLVGAGPAGLLCQSARKQPSTTLDNALRCLVSLPETRQDVLPDLGLKLGDPASIRLYIGSVPGQTPTPGEYYLMIESPDRNRAWILMGYPSGGRFWAEPDAFQLRNHQRQWSVLEGFGGLETYHAFGRFANWMAAHRPAIHLRLKPCAACCAPDPPR